MLRILLILFLFSNLFAKTPQDTLVIAVENEISKINPAYSEDHDEILSLIFSGLTRFDENMNLKPDLAKSWSISEDALTYDFILRDDVLWHDGAKFSASDVKFSIEAFKNPKNNSFVYVNFEDIKDVEILDDYHLRIHLSKPFPALLDALSIGMIPKHLLENENLNTTSFNENPIGTGAYKFVKWWKEYEVIELKANENFHLSKVKTQKLVIKRIFSPLMAVMQLKSGQVDAALVSDFDVLNMLKNDKNFKILQEKSADYRALMFNFENTFLKDLRVRKALNYAVDKKSIVEKLLHNQGFIATHPLQNSWASIDFKDYEYNPKKAENLLLEAGFKKNDKGIFEKNGKALKFEIYTMSNDTLRVSLAKILQSDFKKIGVLSEVVAKPAGSFDYTKVDSFLVGWGSPYDPDFHTFRVFHSSQDSALNEQGWNFGHYKDEIVDESLQKARNTLNLEQRKAEYAKFIKALYENPPFIFLAYLDFSLIYDARIKGVKQRILGHHGVGFSFNVYEWQK